jgi:hypothetical protein
MQRPLDSHCRRPLGSSRPLCSTRLIQQIAVSKIEEREKVAGKYFLLMFSNFFLLITMMFISCKFVETAVLILNCCNYIVYIL